MRRSRTSNGAMAGWTLCWNIHAVTGAAIQRAIPSGRLPAGRQGNLAAHAPGDKRYF